MTGGMVYEAMNNAGAKDSGFIVVLNDNEMSISQSRGSMAQHLGKLRASESYNNFKKNLKKQLKKIPVVGDPLIGGLGALRDAVEYTMVSGVLFEELGFVYLGPIDGHDIGELIEVFSYAKMLNKPVLVHCVTKKGKGYLPAEQNPAKFHGIAPFHPETGVLKKRTQRPSYSKVFGESLKELASENDSIIAITAAMTEGTGLTEFAERMPDRLFDVGIAEEHAVTFAAGAAAEGLHPVVAIYSTFLQRAYDQILIDVCMQNLPVTFCIDRAGVVGADGETHHGIFDLSYLLPMPNLVIFAPSDGKELKDMLEYAVSSDHPCAIRYPRGTAPESMENTPDLPEAERRQEKSLFRSRILRKGSDVTILSAGAMTAECEESCRILENAGIRAELIDARVLKPLDSETLRASAENTGLVFVAEDNVSTGGFGQLCGRSLR